MNPFLHPRTGASMPPTLLGSAFAALPPLPIRPADIDLPPVGRVRPSRRRAWTFTPHQNREHRHLALGMRATGLDRLAAADRDFVAGLIRGRRELTISEGDRLAAIAERLFWRRHDEQRGRP